METNNSLPFGFEKLKTEKPYIKISKLLDGEHKFRIVQRPIAGWIDWKDNKPYRYRPDSKPMAPFDPEKKIKSFWALHVWDYEQEGLYIMDITQIGIIKALENYALNEDWGDLTSFDFKIKKEGSGMDTEYTVIPVPHKPMSDKIEKAVKDTKIRLEALYDGKDPWTDLDVNLSTGEINPNIISDKQCAQLDSLLLELNDDKMEEFICKRAAVSSIYDIPVEKFSGVINYIHTCLTKKKAKELENGSPAVA